jgi:hypothetical protein
MANLISITDKRMLSSHRNKQPLRPNDRSMPSEKGFHMRRNIQLHTRILTSIPSEHCRKMPLCELARMVKLIEHLLEDITMIVVTQEGTSGEISVDEALVTTIAAI